jgi:hypothetical protein
MTPWHSTHPRSSADLAVHGCVPSSSIRRHVRHFSTVTRSPQAQTSHIARDTQFTHTTPIHTCTYNHIKPFRAPFVRALFCGQSPLFRRALSRIQDPRFACMHAGSSIPTIRVLPKYPSSPAQSAPIIAGVGRGRRGSLGEAARIAGADQSTWRTGEVKRWGGACTWISE